MRSGNGDRGMVEQEWISPAQVEERYGVPIETLSYWRRKGYGPTGIHLGRRVKYRASDWVAWTNTLALKLPPQ
jgi:hypothetical protein